jgi:hypothetical protein
MTEIPGYEGLYSVSREGWIFSHRLGRKMRGMRHKKGYTGIILVAENGAKRSTYLHQVVAEVFLGRQPEGTEINHINGSPSDNSADNLEFISHKANLLHAARIGLVRTGEKSHLCRIPLKVVQAIRRIKGLTHSAIAAKFGISQSQVTRIINIKSRTYNT